MKPQVIKTSHLHLKREYKKCLGNHRDVQLPAVAVAVGSYMLGFLSMVRKLLNDIMA